MFRAIANVDMNLDLADPVALANLASDPFSYNPKFKNLNIRFLGDNPGLKPENDGPGILPGDNCETLAANGTGLLDAYSQQTDGGNGALMSYCWTSFQQYPMIDDVVHPQGWALDPKKKDLPDAEGDNPRALRYYDGYGCKNLGDTDSKWMDNTAAVMLHELFHWPGLFSDVPNYATTIWYSSPIHGSNTPIPHMINDFDPLRLGTTQPNPPSGYGAYYASLINKLMPVDQVQGYLQPRQLRLLCIKQDVSKGMRNRLQGRPEPGCLLPHPS